MQGHDSTEQQDLAGGDARYTSAKQQEKDAEEWRLDSRSAFLSLTVHGSRVAVLASECDAWHLRLEVSRWWCSSTCKSVSRSAVGDAAVYASLTQPLQGELEVHL